MWFDISTQWLNFANQYLTGTIDSFFHWLPIALPWATFGKWLLMRVVSWLVFWLIFAFIFWRKD